MNRIDATTARYIKLGPGGAWEETCLTDGTLRLGHSEIPHALALTGDREAIRSAFLSHGLTPAKASDKTREIQAFYDQDEKALWVTFAHGQMWWCRAEAEVAPNFTSAKPHGDRIRRVWGAWSNKSLGGTVLHTTSLSGHLTRTASYRQNICKISDLTYLLAKLNDDQLPDVTEATRARDSLLTALLPLIRRMTWQDFELFVDLIFTTSGWRRVGVLGGIQKTVDIELELPSTGERAFVQVKSETDQAELDTYIQHLAARNEGRMFYAYHSQRSQMSANAREVTLLGPERLAHMALDAGLTNWILTRAT